MGRKRYWLKIGKRKEFWKSIDGLKLVVEWMNMAIFVTTWIFSPDMVRRHYTVGAR